MNCSNISDILWVYQISIKESQHKSQQRQTYHVFLLEANILQWFLCTRCIGSRQHVLSQVFLEACGSIILLIILFLIKGQDHIISLGLLQENERHAVPR